MPTPEITAAELIAAVRLGRIEDAEAARLAEAMSAEPAARVRLTLALRRSDVAEARRQAVAAWELGNRDRMVAAAIVQFAPEYAAHHDAERIVLAPIDPALAGAIASAATRVEAAPTSIAAWASLVRGLIAARLDGEAVRAMHAAISDGAIPPDGWLVLAAELWRGGHITGARTMIDDLAERASEPELCALAGLARLADRDLEGARAMTLRAVALNVDISLVWVAVYAVAMVDGDAEASRGARRRAIGLGVDPQLLDTLSPA